MIKKGVSVRLACILASMTMISLQGAVSKNVAAGTAAVTATVATAYYSPTTCCCCMCIATTWFCWKQRAYEKRKRYLTQATSIKVSDDCGKECSIAINDSMTADDVLNAIKKACKIPKNFGVFLYPYPKDNRTIICNGKTLFRRHMLDYVSDTFRYTTYR